MDVGFGVIKESTNELYYSGALMDCLILRNGEWITIKGNRFHVGHSAELIPFTNHHIQLQKGDQIFLASDGVIDQFGGEFNKKFMRKRFLATIENNNTGSMEKIGAVISEALAVWQGKSEQTDDICALGIRV
jgi:serine phosphatase RsbU (regulator of sigma subunit)